ncbi:MAG TPA: 4Fe-4S dicluster domain-containing protein, partial [Vicinamibacterales bacterium]|nr:4Fe-4S dicluster domain-containing protein [Vicinamibacterales bacterium]
MQPHAAPPAQETQLREDIARCVHCGFCLQACPTYLQLGMETDSPRGRIALIDAMTSGRAQPTAPLLAHLDLCLQCRACETACPSGVPFGRIMEAG